MSRSQSRRVASATSIFHLRILVIQSSRISSTRETRHSIHLLPRDTICIFQVFFAIHPAFGLQNSNRTTRKMLATRPAARIDAKRRATVDPRKRQFAKAQYQEQDYNFRMNFYAIPPTGDISLEQFEEWGIARLKVLAELEACQFRNRSPEETAEYMRPILQKNLPLSANSSRSGSLAEERKRDHYSHWTLRLAFSATEDLRKRFARLETMLFRLRLAQDDGRERREFIESLNMDWETVGEEEKAMFGEELRAATGAWRAKGEEEGWFKVDWERVPELVEQRRVLLKKGKAYVHIREQTSMVVGEFSRQLEAGLEVSQQDRFTLLSYTDRNAALCPCLTTHGRGQPSLPNSPPSLQIFHRSRHRLFPGRLLNNRQYTSQRRYDRLCGQTLPSLHAEPSP